MFWFFFFLNSVAPCLSWVNTMCHINVSSCDLRRKGHLRKFNLITFNCYQWCILEAWVSFLTTLFAVCVVIEWCNKGNALRQKEIKIDFEGAGMDDEHCQVTYDDALHPTNAWVTVQIRWFVHITAQMSQGVLYESLECMNTPQRPPRGITECHWGSPITLKKGHRCQHVQLSHQL